MKNVYIREILLGLPYGALMSLGYIGLTLGLVLDHAVYPFQKPLMIVLGVCALLACVVFAVIDICRQRDVSSLKCIIVRLAVIICTFTLFRELWGLLIISTVGI